MPQYISDASFGIRGIVSETSSIRATRSINLEFDGEAVAVPPGHVADFPPPQHVVAINEVLQNLETIGRVT